MGTLAKFEEGIKAIIDSVGGDIPKLRSANELANALSLQHAEFDEDILRGVMQIMFKDSERDFALPFLPTVHHPTELTSKVAALLPAWIGLEVVLGSDLPKDHMRHKVIVLRGAETLPSTPVAIEKAISVPAVASLSVVSKFYRLMGAWRKAAPGSMELTWYGLVNEARVALVRDQSQLILQLKVSVTVVDVLPVEALSAIGRIVGLPVLLVADPSEPETMPDADRAVMDLIELHCPGFVAKMEALISADDRNVATIMDVDFIRSVCDAVISVGREAHRYQKRTRYLEQRIETAINDLRPTS
jgi:hypothetical protein